MTDSVPTRLLVAIDQIIYARQREWRRNWLGGIDHLKLREMLYSAVREELRHKGALAPLSDTDAQAKYHGDDKTIETCRLKFDDVPNFGGGVTHMGQNDD